MNAKCAVVVAGILGLAQFGAGAAAPPKSADALIQQLEGMRGPLALAQYRADLRNDTAQYQADTDLQVTAYKARMGDQAAKQSLSEPKSVPYSSSGVDYGKVGDEARAACKAWAVGKPANVKTAERVYCSVWMDTLLDYVYANGGSKFTESAAGAQYMRAKAEFRAASGD